MKGGNRIHTIFIPVPSLDEEVSVVSLQVFNRFGGISCSIMISAESSAPSLC